MVVLILAAALFGKCLKHCFDWLIDFIYTTIQIDAILVISSVIILLKLFEQGITNGFIYLSLPRKSGMIGKLGQRWSAFIFFIHHGNIIIFNFELYTFGFGLFNVRKHCRCNLEARQGWVTCSCQNLAWFYQRNVSSGRWNVKVALLLSGNFNLYVMSCPCFLRDDTFVMSWDTKSGIQEGYVFWMFLCNTNITNKGLPKWSDPLTVL